MLPKRVCPGLSVFLQIFAKIAVRRQRHSQNHASLFWDHCILCGFWVRRSFKAKRFGMLPHAVSRNSSFKMRGARCAEETIEEKSCLHQSLQKVFHPNGSSRQKLFLCKSLSVRLLDRMSRARPTDTICVRPTKTCRAHCCLAVEWEARYFVSFWARSFGGRSFSQ